MSSFQERNKNITITRILIVFLLFALTIVACAADETDYEDSDAIEKIEVYHFHPQQQCYSCILLGEMVEETLEKYFADELESETIVFAHLNVDDPENQEIVDLYEAPGSSLMIGVYTADGFSKEEDIKVWYKIGDQEEFESYLVSLIEKRLEGIMI